jgi:transcriptional regulator with XRE-family HTH domain
MASIRDQLKTRRIALGLKQHDMLLRVGMSRQQYQKLESSGNPRLDTLELLAKGLKAQLMLIPDDKLEAMAAVLEGKETARRGEGHPESENPVADDPWRGLLGDEA